MRKKGKAVLITGATKRLGLAFTKQSLSMGFSVIAHYRSTAAPLKTWLAKNNPYKKKVYFIRYNLEKNPELLIDKCSDFPVTLTGLVNNASTFTKGNLDDIEHLKKTITVNTTAPLLLSQRLQQRVKKGWVVNISDAVTSFNKTYQNYRISKRLLNEQTLQLAYLFAPSIRVNALAPAALLPSTQNEKAYFRKLKETAPLKKTDTITSLMKAFTFLVENTSITGQILYVDNGLHLCI